MSMDPGLDMLPNDTTGAWNLASVHTICMS
jgi:hypothetical protein